MKFSEIESNQWDELKPYLDTCLLPVTGLTGLEQPDEATQALEQLRDVMDAIEIPFKGRVVTYPACHYIGESGDELVESVCQSLKQAGFRFVIIVSAKLGRLKPASADLIIVPDPDGGIANRDEIGRAVRAMWTADFAS
ncbi:DUF2487 family protein [Paenibacillus xylaniclasticus]|uniref:DUF2487 family protein n=1 Tax=Paenibacillus xylaniclasticus TaxID=588083 RepID=UPI000FDB1455|nr:MULTISPECIES: DUF2487 family protein [Paenibacillus]GFN30668.1 hypothetical protein PCURB6_09280 [Paenibacillus curdlanolyticus]